MAAPSLVDPVSQYLDRIGRYPLLEAAEEQRLAAAIADGRSARALLADDTTLCPTDQARLRRRVRAGDQAFEAFVNANLRLVVSVAKRYQATGVPLLDLVQEGNLGLIRAVEKFDHSKGFRFSTYGVWWIRQFITRGVAGSRGAVKLPSRAHDELQRLRVAVRQADPSTGRASTIAEVAEVTALAPDRVAELLPLLSEPVSLSAPLASGEAELGDLIEDPSAAATVDALGDRLLPDEVERLLEPLDPRERSIIVLRYGFDGSEGHSTAEVSEIIGLSRERIRQLEHRAIAKLSHPSRPPLRSFIRGC